MRFLAGTVSDLIPVYVQYVIEIETDRSRQTRQHRFSHNLEVQNPSRHAPCARANGSWQLEVRNRAQCIINLASVSSAS